MTRTEELIEMEHRYGAPKRWTLEAIEAGEAVSIGWVGDIGDLLENLLKDAG